MASIIKTSINLNNIPKDKIIEGKKGIYIVHISNINNSPTLNDETVLEKTAEKQEEIRTRTLNLDNEDSGDNNKKNIFINGISSIEYNYESGSDTYIFTWISFSMGKHLPTKGVLFFNKTAFCIFFKFVSYLFIYSLQKL